MKSYDTLSEAITGLKARGYDKDFNLLHDQLECKSEGRCLNPADFHVDEVHRYEGMSNTDDNAVLYAISASDGMKGLLVDAYGMYADSLSPEMIEKLKIDKNTGWS